MRRVRQAGLWMAAAIVFASCGGTSEIRTFEGLRRAAPRPLRLLAIDSTVYELTTYAIHDSTLEGSGTRTAGRVRTPFSGELAYRDLVYIQRLERGMWRTASAMTVMAAGGAYFAAATRDHEMVVYHKGEGSCPYVSVWDGHGYALQGEAFGTAFGRALETATTCILPAARARTNTLLVRIANERPETHYVNSVRLLAYETGPESEVVIDGEGRAWPVTDPIPPIATHSVVSGSDPGDSSSASAAVARVGIDRSLRDALILEFARPRDASAASLIVRAINTDLVYSAFELVFGYLGDQALPFLYQVEHDPGLVTVLKGWIEECSLAVELWDGERWVSAGAIAPEGSAVEFSRILRIDLAAATNERALVRLSWLAGGWRVETATIDWSPAAPLEARPLAMRKATLGDRPAAAADLLRADDRHAAVFPGERIDLAFDTARGRDSHRIAYAIEVRGYLLEWPPEPGVAGVASLLPADRGAARDADRDPDRVADRDPDRVAVVNALIRDREALLALIYDRWPRRPGASPPPLSTRRR